MPDKVSRSPIEQMIASAKESLSARWPEFDASEVWDLCNYALALETRAKALADEACDHLYQQHDMFRVRELAKALRELMEGK